jgi:hypothetical protein
LFTKRRIEPMDDMVAPEHVVTKKPSVEHMVVRRFKDTWTFNKVQKLVRSLSSKSSLPDLVHDSISPSSSDDSFWTDSDLTDKDVVASGAWQSSMISMPAPPSPSAATPKIKGVLKSPASKSEPDLRRCVIPDHGMRQRHYSLIASKLTGRGKPHVHFRKNPSVHHTYSKSQYDRQTDQDAICLHLTVDVAGAIKNELNNYKMTEMAVHDQSRIYTHYFA